MKVRTAASWVSVLFVGGLNVLQQPVAAQYQQMSRAKLYESGWENDRVRVSKVSVAPGAEMQTGADRVLVFLTADLQNRMPASEAIWQPGGTREENRGALRSEAIVIEMKNAPPADIGTTPPEALPVTGMIDSHVLIDNPRVVVTKLRYSPNSYAGDAWHLHPQDAVIVYLRGGYTWVPGGSGDTYRVSRGDIDVLPANTIHTFGNAGGDPLEFLVIFPK
jgi:quercetin dioxygenase-like cupin family protein